MLIDRLQNGQFTTLTLYDVVVLRLWN